MIYAERVYGKIEINEPVLLELINSPSVQRLKGVGHGAYFSKYFPYKEPSRFDHCLGVMVLLKKFGASIEEQVAGLIHDVSHTAFGHIIDFILGSGHLQNFQDNRHEEFIRRSGIPTILQKHGVDFNSILEEKNFPLLENKLPDICADRIDYSLRWLTYYPPAKDFAQEFIKIFLSSLRVNGNKWVITDLKTAKKFVNIFSQLNLEIWAGPSTAVMTVTLANLLKYSIEKHYITMKDLDLTESDVESKITPHLKSDNRLKVFFQRATHPHKFRDTQTTPDIQTSMKSRAIDPWVGEKRYSDLAPEYKPVLEKTLKPVQYSLKLVE